MWHAGMIEPRIQPFLATWPFDLFINKKGDFLVNIPVD